jgi:hypothetical protein
MVFPLLGASCPHGGLFEEGFVHPGCISKSLLRRCILEEEHYNNLWPKGVEYWRRCVLGGLYKGGFTVFFGVLKRGLFEEDY